jgi:hypothetical protein
VGPTVGFEATHSEAVEARGDHPIVITLRNADPGETYSVDYAVTEGTAEGNGIDYTLEPGTLTFEPGVTELALSVSLFTDTVLEWRETVVVTLSNPVIGYLGGITEHTITIRDLDALWLKVDLALPRWGSNEPVPGTVKPGWWPFVANRWADMYSHDAVWEDGSNGEGPPPAGPGIADTGVHVALGTGDVGQGGLHVKGMCRDNLAGDAPPTGAPVGDPIANSWLYAVDWAGDPGGDILMRINGLPSGTYELVSYHNHWEPCSQGTRNCMDCVCGMPPMPAIRALPGEEGRVVRQRSFGREAWTSPHSSPPVETSRLDCRS